MDDHRRYKRHQVPLKVEFWQDPAQPLRAEARDMSESGLFLLVDESFQLEEGEEITVRSLGLGPDGTDNGPELAMRVVRRCADGMGLEVITCQDSHKEENETREQTQHHSSPKAIIQRLIIIDDDDLVLLRRLGDHWHLPCRELGFEESWKDGLQACLYELQQLGAIDKISQIEPARQCIPAAETDYSCIELLVPCRYLKNSAAGMASDNVRWESVSGLAELGYAMDESIIKSLGLAV